MATDRQLNTVLQLYRSVHNEHRTNQIIGSTTSLLTTLSNPLNLGVLTSQLLIAPAIWHRREGLRTSLRLISIYNSAAIRVRENEIENAKPYVAKQGGGLGVEAWTHAVVKGADDKSSRWQHLLMLTGVLMGMESNERRSLSNSLKNTLESAVVTAANLALETAVHDGPIASASIVLALNYVFPLLSEFHRDQINSNALLPLIIEGVTGDEGFQHGSFLSVIGRDVREVGTQLSWDTSAPSFPLLRQLDSKPLIGGLGSLAKLAAFSVERATDSSVVFAALSSLRDFSDTLMQQWQANRLSAVDQSEEPVAFTPETLQITTPALWQTFKKILFATVTILQAVVARSLLDPGLRNDVIAPQVADSTLRALRSLFFIGWRDGNNAFQVYSFTYLTSLDTLVRYPDASVAFLASLKPIHPASPQEHRPKHALDRVRDLFYLNVSEHLPLNIPMETCDSCIVQPASFYLTQPGPMSPLTVELFEAAHSAILSTLSCPHNGPLSVRLIPFYIDTLLASFPSQISTRQFRVAFKTVMEIVSPPFPLAASDPYLSETLLEMLRFRAVGASAAPLPVTPDTEAQDAPSQALSEQSSLVIALVDSLPYLPLPLVEEWLAITAGTMNAIEDQAMRQPVKDRFLEVLVSGELDVERSAIGVAWWGTKGGRELVLGGLGQGEIPVMSGAIMDDEQEPTSRL